MTRVIITHRPSGESSVYFMSKDQLLAAECATATTLKNFASRIINPAEYGDFNIAVLENAENDYLVPLEIELDNEYLRYFDIESMYTSYNISEKITAMIAEECAYNDEYCDFISNIIMELSNNGTEYGVKLAYELSNFIFTKAIEILNDHMKKVEENYRIYYNKSNSDAQLSTGEDKND